MARSYGDIIDGASRSDAINQNGLVIDMEKFTHLLDESGYFFEALTRKVGRVIPCDRMKHEYRERRPIRNYLQPSAAASAGASTFTTNDYDRIKADNYLYNTTTGDLMLVGTAPTSSTVTFTGTATAGSGTLPNAWATTDIIIVLGESHAEGEDVPEAYSVKSINKYDYIMQKDRRITTTDIEEAELHYDPTEQRNLDRKMGMIEYRRDMNMLFYVGKNGREVTSASGPRRHCCGGLIEKITENTTDFSVGGASFTLSAIEAMMSDTKFHTQSSERKTGLFGTKPWSAISSWGRDALQVSPRSKEWGMKVNTLITGFGDLDCSYDPVLNETMGLQGEAFIIDTQHVRQLQMKGLPVKVILNIPNLSNIHTTIDAITGTFGLQLLFPELHARGYKIGA